MTHHKQEQTLVIIKPDGIQRSLIGEVIGRFERIGLKLIGMKMIQPTNDMVEQHYTLDPEWRRLVGEKSMKGLIAQGKKPISDDPLVVAEHILGKLKKYVTAGPVIAMVLQGAHAVAIVRKLVGSTEPLSSDVGTIRGDFMLDSYELSEAEERAIRNIVHASSSVVEAKSEIGHWFKKDEIFSYDHVQEQVLYSK